MCGLAGYIGPIKNTPKKGAISMCLSSLKLRVQMRKEFIKKKENQNNVLFLHIRLSIIDLNKNSNQPFKDNTGSIVFNGMIYNYLELRKHLKKKGEKFTTNSDTEVLLKLLNIYSYKAISMLDGMWSFVYYNFKKKIILSRDSFGEKKTIILF